MKKLYRYIQTRALQGIYDILAIPVAWLLAYGLFFNLRAIPEPYWQEATSILPLIVVIQFAAYWAVGLKRGIWRFASMADLIRIIKAILLGALVSLFALEVVLRLLLVPRSVFVLYSMLLGILLCAPRFTYRWIKDRYRLFHKGKRVLIVGAGEAGESLARDILRRGVEQYLPVAFVDDNARMWGREVHGVRVIGGCENIPDVVDKYAVELVMIAIPSAQAAAMRRIVTFCEEAETPYSTLPGLSDFIEGRISTSALRDVSLDDLLGRDPMQLDWGHIHAGIAGKTVLVTGGGGSIGSELCHQIARREPETLLIIEQSEFNLYSLEMMLRKRHPELSFQGFLVDIVDREAVRQIISEHRIDIVFHAAAYKHVPLLQNQLRIAVKNNVIGSKVVADAAVDYKVKTFVMISTDKAVNPTNIMGATKRCAEILCQNYNSQSSTNFITVRFGNVLGSAGSVVPLFKQQIEAGGPVTVTHPDITRYFMTIPEATQLILQATMIGKGGEIFVLDMGESVKISDLAKQMIRLAGYEPEIDIPIAYIGLRPGEKLYEELFHEAEHNTRTEYEKILIASSRQHDWPRLVTCFAAMQEACHYFQQERLYGLLSELVPEFNDINRTLEKEALAEVL